MITLFTDRLELVHYLSSRGGYLDISRLLNVKQVINRDFRGLCHCHLLLWFYLLTSLDASTSVEGFIALKKAKLMPEPSIMIA